MSNQAPLMALAGQTKFKLDRKVAERLAALDKTHQLGMARMGDLNSADIRSVWTSLQAKALAALKRAQNVDDVEQIGEPSKQAIQAAAADARASLKHSLREVSREANDIALPEVKRFVQAATDHIDQLESNEREITVSFGITYQQSALVLALKELVANLKSRSEREWPGMIVRPASMVEAFSPIV